MNFIKPLSLAVLLSCGVSHGAELFGVRDLNAAGSVLSLTNGAGQSVSRSYHEDGSLATSTNLLGNSLVVSYNSVGLPALQSIAAGSGAHLRALLKGSAVSPGIAYTYDSLGQLIKAVRIVPPGSTVIRSESNYTYYSNGQLKMKTDSFIKPGSNTPAAKETRHVLYTYDPYSGNVLTKQSWIGSSPTLPISGVSTWDYAYNGDGQLSSINYYSGSGSVTSSASGSNSTATATSTTTSTPTFTLSYSYNDKGQVSEIQRSPGYNTYNIYGTGIESNRLVGILIGSGTYASMVSAYSSLTSTMGNDATIDWSSLTSASSPNTDTKIIEGYFYTYSLAGNPLEIDIASNTSKAQGYIKQSYGYNIENELTNFSVMRSNMTQGSSTALYPKDSFGTPLKGESFVYDSNNRITSVTKVAAGLSNATSATLTLRYHYDTSTGHPDRLNSITGSSSTNYPYAQEIESLNQKSYVYNAAGAVITDPEGDHYTYGLHNRMLESQGPEGTTDVYGYNVSGLLDYENSTLYHLRVIDQGAAGPISAPRKALSGQNGVPVYMLGSVSEQGNTRTSSLSGLATFTSTNNQAPEIRDLYEVGEGNVALTTGYANSKNTVTNEYAYTPYGVQSNAYHPISINKTLMNGSYEALMNQTRKPLNISKNRTGYTGQDLDPSTGLMMLGGFRNYAPGIGQFIQPDTYNSFSKHSITNPYAYVLNNPMMYTDPTGHSAWGDFWHEAVAGAVGVSVFTLTGGSTTLAIAAQSAMTADLNTHGQITARSYGMAVATNAATDYINAAATATAVVLTPVTGGASAVAGAIVISATTSAIAGAASTAASEGINDDGHVSMKDVDISAGIGAIAGGVTAGIGEGAGSVLSRAGAAVGKLMDTGADVSASVAEDQRMTFDEATARRAAIQDQFDEVEGPLFRKTSDEAIARIGRLQRSIFERKFSMGQSRELMKNQAFPFSEDRDFFTDKLTSVTKDQYTARAMDLDKISQVMKNYNDRYIAVFRKAAQYNKDIDVGFKGDVGNPNYFLDDKQSYLGGDPSEFLMSWNTLKDGRRTIIDDRLLPSRVLARFPTF